MKKLISSLVLSLTLMTGQAFAHSGGHGNIAAGDATRIARTAAKMLTQQAHGFEIGKLDSSWQQVAREHYKLEQLQQHFYLVSAVNPKNKQKLYFKVGKEGQILDISEQLPNE